ncbi:TetR/AcrR family transcriptional regulator [Actinotalea sp. M2MS4P-6]|uniref:TetR/AcrR family transcriptional regulator n=1 Tax=Actinotalea sp. M2MS4P-6 TaxID=2983762 RepID=UPI0021E4F0DF|nr:TetR/AcrR family transcriptional regulator [Actinotalea sp. M2MS4P-6]MCV2396389.1 TetR/AcrR family transcriptional regulator [Actinotalea sp. M2MS4P-6]
MVDAATRLLLEEGVAAVTVRRVAAEAGYSVASLYNHVDGIEDLLAAVRDRLEADLVADLGRLVDPAPSTIDELAEVFVGLARFHLDHPAAFELFFSRAPETRAAVRARRAGHRDHPRRHPSGRPCRPRALITGRTDV